MASRRKKKDGFEPNIELDAVLVHAATPGLFAPCAMNLGMTPDEAYGRAYWLKRQTESYTRAVCERVVELEQSAAAAKPSEVME